MDYENVVNLLITKGAEINLMKRSEWGSYSNAIEQSFKYKPNHYLVNLINAGGILTGPHQYYEAVKRLSHCDLRVKKNTKRTNKYN